jgi:oxalate---CoA ligase
MLIADACAQASEGSGDQIAFLMDDGAPVSFGSVHASVARITRALVDAGVQTHDRIAFAAPRSPVGLIGFMGISAAAVCCPLNPRLKAAEYKTFFESITPVALVATAPTEAALPAERAGVPVVTLEGLEQIEVSLGGAIRSRKEGAGSPRGRFALLMQTSGTTAEPKVVLLTHENILSAARGIANAFALGSRDFCLNPMPLHHVHGLISAGLASLVAGSPAHCCESFSPEEFDARYERFQPTWVTGSPAMHIALREYYRKLNRVPRNPKLRFLRSSSAPLPASVIEDIEQIFGAPLIETYGLTETASMIATNPLPPAGRKIGSVGVACGAEMRVVDDKGDDVPTESVGEIVVRGDSVIRAYADAEANTRDHFFGAWLRTGDLGRVDADGYYFITGRRKELIKRGGLSVYPGEIDNLLMSDRRVAEAATFSIPHPTLGEEVVAVVVAATGANVSGDTLRETLLNEVSTYKVPAEIFVVEAITKTDTGKIDRKRLAESYRELLRPRAEPAANATEQALLVEWQRALGRTDLGVTDNVFLFGADPIRAGQVCEQVARSLGPRLSAGDMFRAPTVRQQAALMSPAKIASSAIDRATSASPDRARAERGPHPDLLSRRGRGGDSGPRAPGGEGQGEGRPPARSAHS